MVGEPLVQPLTPFYLRCQCRVVLVPEDARAGHGDVCDGPDPGRASLGDALVVGACAEGDLVDPPTLPLFRSSLPLDLCPTLVAAREPVVASRVVVVVAAVQAPDGPPVTWSRIEK